MITAISSTDQINLTHSINVIGAEEQTKRRVEVNQSGNNQSDIFDSVELSGVQGEKFAATYSKDIIFENFFRETGFSSELKDPEESPEEEQTIKELEARDREVRTHEQTHAAILGQYATGGPSYTYQVGPDGRMYAVGGSITADIGKESTPEATANKARILRMAAISVGEPSVADMAMVLTAIQLENSV